MWLETQEKETPFQHGLQAIPQLGFSSKLRRTFNLKQKEVSQEELVHLEEMDVIRIWIKQTLGKYSVKIIIGLLCVTAPRNCTTFG